MNKNSNEKRNKETEMDEAYWKLRSAVERLMKMISEMGIDEPKIIVSVTKGLVEDMIKEYTPTTEFSEKRLS